MDPPRSSSRSSRRSYPNLQNLSLAPLSTKPLDASLPPSPSEAAALPPHTSYIQLKSAPSTPGILSLSQSRSNSRNGGRGRRARGGISYAYDGYFPHTNADVSLRDTGDIPKAKSTTALLPGHSVSFVEQQSHGGKHHTRKRTAPIALPLLTPLSGPRHHTHTDTNDEWLHRAGLVIAGEMRESKGQSWLVRRESSTSLVGQADDYQIHPSHSHDRANHMALLSGEHLADDEYSPNTPRHSRLGSRIGSRVASARNSRRGSRVGSRTELVMSAAGKIQSRQSLELEDSMFADDNASIEPDFVDDGESDGDEEEVARLARERGFGLGSWMDRLIGWTLFSVDEDGESSSSDEEEEDDIETTQMTTLEERKLRKEVEAKRKKMDREAINAASAANLKEAREKAEAEAEANARGQSADQQPSNEDGGGWQDAAWLLSVASKVMF